MIVRKYKILVVFFIWALMSSCTKNNTNYGTKIDLNITNKEPVDINLSEFVDSIYYVPLETTTESFIAQIYKVKYACGSYFVFDEKQHILFCFDKSGKYKYRIDSHGKGKGEFIRIFDFDIWEKTNSLVVRDGVTKKLLYYDAQTGKFIKEVKANLLSRSIMCIDDGFVVCSLNKPYQTPSNNAELFICDLNYNPIEVLTHYPIEFQYVHPFDFMSLYRFNDTIYFSRPWSPNIYAIDIQKKEAVLKYRIDLGNDEFAIKTLRKTQTLENSMQAYLARRNSKEIIYNSHYYIESKPKFIFNNVLLVKAERQQQSIWILYNKRTQGYKLFTKIKNDVDAIYPDKYLSVAGRTEEELICKMNGSEFEEKIDEVKASNLPNSIALSQLKSVDNPVLVILHLK